MDLFCYSCFMFVFIMLSQPCDYLLGKGWSLGFLVCVVFLCCFHFESFPYGVLGQVLYLIPDLCLLLYLVLAKLSYI